MNSKKPNDKAKIFSPTDLRRILAILRRARAVITAINENQIPQTKESESGNR
jgi:hypothetical protein